MITIDTDFDRVTVEIEGAEYELAPNTIETAEKLERIDREMTGKQPQYKIWLAEIEVLLGKNAANTLFSRGKGEDINRIHCIHSGLVRAFNHVHDEIEAENSRHMEDLAGQIAPINEFLRRVQSMKK